MTAKPPTEALARALSFHVSVFAAAADERHDLPWGRAWRSPSIPLHPDLNTILLPRSTELDCRALLRAAEGLRSRQVEIWDEATADRVGPQLEAAGWEQHRLLMMAFAGQAADAPDGVDSTTYAEAEPLRREWIGAIPRLAPIVEVDIAAGRRITATTPTTCFVAREDGRAVATAQLMGDGPVRMIEDVYTTPSHRGRGVASRVVTAAVAAAGAAAELVFLATGATNEAQRLYRRLGFEPLGEVARLTAP